MNEDNQSHEMNEAVMKKLQSYHRKGRMLTTLALAIGCLSIGAGVFLMWANSEFLSPEVQLLVQQFDAAHTGNTNSAAKINTADSGLTLSDDGKIVNQQVLVTLMLGKAMYVTSRAVALVGLGTLLTLLLVIFNRRVTLRQVNASLAQISQQIKELQANPGGGPAGR